MRTDLTPDLERDDELAQATGNAWWTPISARLLDQLTPELTLDVDPPASDDDEMGAPVP